jgi:hypothetical protein
MIYIYSRTDCCHAVKFNSIFKVVFKWDRISTILLYCSCLGCLWCIGKGIYMSIFLYIHTCMYILLKLYRSTCMCTYIIQLLFGLHFMSLRRYVHVYIFIYIHVYIFIYTHMCILLKLYRSSCMCTYIIQLLCGLSLTYWKRYIHVYIFIYIYMSIFFYIHTCIFY